MKCHEASITFHQEIWRLPRFHVISTKKGHRKNLFSATLYATRAYSRHLLGATIAPSLVLGSV